MSIPLHPAASNPSSDAGIGATLHAWRTAFEVARSLERAYLFVHLIQDARLLRHRSEQALIQGMGGGEVPWWSLLLPARRGVPTWERAVAERRFWRRFVGVEVPQLPAQDLGDALAWARAGALLREGPDGHATLVLAELAAGEFRLGAQRLAAIEARNWRAAAEEPRRVEACLALARAALADQRGDRLGLRRELQSLAPLANSSLELLAALLVLHLDAGDAEGLEAVRAEWGRRSGPVHGDGPAWAPLRPALRRWSAGFGADARLHLGYLLESCGAVEGANVMGGAGASQSSLAHLLVELA